MTNQQIYEKAVQFYQRLRIIFTSAIFAAAEVEQRFFELGNHWDLNTKDIDRLAITFGRDLRKNIGPRRPGIIARRPDQVHLTNERLDKYWEIIIASVDYVISRN